MRPILIPALVAAMLATPVLAVTTAQHEAIGTVKSWNSNARYLTLDSGATYTLPAGTRTEFQPGERVRLTYQFRDGRNIASDAKVMR